MSNLADTLSPIIGAAWNSPYPAREAVTQIYALGIENITDEKPLIERTPNRNFITWQSKEQIRKMQKALTSLILPDFRKEPVIPSKEFSLDEVQVDMKPIIVPLVLKTLLPSIAIYTAIVWYAARKTKRRK